MNRIAIAGFVALLVGGLVALSAQETAKVPAAETKHGGLRIKLTSVLVEDQEKALAFYTEKLGFVKKTDVPAGGGRWLTVVAANGPDDLELLLEPLGFPPAKTFQKAVFDAGIPYTMFIVDDIQAEYDRLKANGVVFRGKPEKFPTHSHVIFEDTCGNLIMITQPQG